MNIENLRAYALNHAPTLPIPICLDYTLRSELKRLYDRHRALLTRRDKLAADVDIPAKGNMGEKEPRTLIDGQITDCETEIEAAQLAAKPHSVVLIFRRLPATSDSSGDGQPNYEALKRQADSQADTPAEQHDILGRLLAANAFLRAENADSQPVEGDWQDVLQLVDFGDLDFLRNALIGFHQIGSTIPFDPRTFGAPDTT